MNIGLTKIGKLFREHCFGVPLGQENEEKEQLFNWRKRQTLYAFLKRGNNI